MTMLEDPLRTARLAVRAGRFREALAELDRVDQSVQESAEGLLLGAMADWRLGRFAASRALARRARAAFRETGDADGEMRAENVAAAGAFGLGDLEEAEEGFSRAMLLAKQVGDDLMVARCSNNLGNIALYLAQHDTAQAYYARARVGFGVLAFNYGVAETLINTAIVWRDLGRMDEALAAADEALEAAERAAAPRLLAEAFAARGDALATLGDVPLGTAQVRRGLQLARDEADRLAEADVLRMLANVARLTGQYESAIGSLREALSVAEETENPWSLAKIRRDQGEVYADMGKPTLAAAAFDQAADQFLKLGSIPRAEAVRHRAAQNRKRSR